MRATSIGTIQIGAHYTEGIGQPVSPGGFKKQINEERIYVSLNERGENSHTAQGTALDRALGYFEFDLVLKHVT